MSISSISLLPIKHIYLSSNLSSSCYSSFTNKVQNPLKHNGKYLVVFCLADLHSQAQAQSSSKWRTIVTTALAAAVVVFGADMSAVAELNKYEADTHGEFGIGSAAQFGSADLK